MRTKLLIVLAVVLGGAIGVLFLEKESAIGADRAIDRAGLVPSAAAQPQHNQFKTAAVGDGPAQVPRLGSGTLLKDFNSATSLRAFVYAALKNPEQGGYAYAFAALGFCRQTQAQPDKVVYEGQREAYAELARRCDMSTEEIRAAKLQFAADRQSKFSNDPYMKLSFDLLRAKTEQEQKQVLQHILDTQDPLVLPNLVRPVDRSREGGDGEAVYFAGRYYQSGDQLGLFDLAVQLAQCDLGLDCSAGSLSALSLCLRQRWCGGSYRDALRTGLGAENAVRFAQIETLAKQLTAEIRKKNVSPFFR